MDTLKTLALVLGYLGSIAAFLAGGLTLYPARSLVRNTGFDGTGTHSGSNWEGRADLATEQVEVVRIPIAESECFKNLMIKVMYRKPTIMQKELFIIAENELRKL